MQGTGAGFVPKEQMNVLELFAGVGGGVLASLLNGHRTVCAVENDDYCQCVLLARQNDGTFPVFPVWDDVRTFSGKPWRGYVDLVSGGFPCQNISTAGDGAGINGAKSSLWFEMLRIVREVRPRYVFVENSPALVTRGLDTVLGGLAEIGFDAEWMVLGASDVGAPHRRQRMWILAKHSDADRVRKPQPKRAVQDLRRRTGNVCKEISDADDKRLEKANITSGLESKFAATIDGGWWRAEPGLDRVAHGVPDRTHRIKALGNAQVPLCAATAFNLLYERINKPR